MLRKLSVSLVLLIGFVVVTPVFSAATVHAAPAAGVCGKESPGLLSFPTWYKYLNIDSSNGSCNVSLGSNPEEQAAGVGKILLAVFEILLRIGGLAAVGFVIYGGFQYLISQGEPERTKGARTTILNALIGLAIMLTATAIVNVIGNSLK